MADFVSQDEAARIRESLARNGGNISRAAAEVGRSRATVKQYAIPGAPDIEALVRDAVARALAGIQAPPQPAPVQPVPHRDPGEVVVGDYRRVIFASDMHHPMQDDAAIDRAVRVAREAKADLFVVGGDYFDSASIGRWSKKRGTPSMQEEFDSARPTTAKIESLGCDVVFLTGNHDARLADLATEHHGLDRMAALDLARAAGLPERWRVLPSQARLRVGPVTFLHGDVKGRVGSARFPAPKLLDVVGGTYVFGHFHRAGMASSPRGVAVASGHLCKPELLDYITLPDWTKSFVEVRIEQGLDAPTFVHHPA